MTSVERIPFEKYVDLPGVHATALKDLLVSPRLYQQRLLQPRPDTDSLRVGRACHTAVLEPDRFLLEYTVWRAKEDGSTRVRRGKEWDAFCEANHDKTILTEAQYTIARSCRDAARNHPVASKLLNGPGKNEVSVRFKHERTGFECKARIDRICTDIIDIKTTRDPSPHKFSADAARLAYAMQLSFYWRAARAAGLGELPCKIIAIQNVMPFDVVVYEIGTDLLVHGEQQYEQALDKLAECMKTNTWPGLAPTEELPLSLPAWAVPGAEDEQLTFNGEAI